MVHALAHAHSTWHRVASTHGLNLPRSVDSASHPFLPQLDKELPDAALLKLKELLGDEALLEDVQRTLAATIPNLIAMNWELDAGDNMLEALVRKVAARMPSRDFDAASQSWSCRPRPSSSTCSSRPLPSPPLNSSSDFVCF